MPSAVKLNASDTAARIANSPTIRQRWPAESALDRVAMTQEPEYLSVYTSTLAWWLLRRLRSLGFVVYWPSWVMCSVPLPGLDRYVPTRPPHLL